MTDDFNMGAANSGADYFNNFCSPSFASAFARHRTWRRDCIESAVNITTILCHLCFDKRVDRIVCLVALFPPHVRRQRTLRGRRKAG